MFNKLLVFIRYYVLFLFNGRFKLLAQRKRFFNTVTVFLTLDFETQIALNSHICMYILISLRCQLFYTGSKYLLIFKLHNVCISFLKVLRLWDFIRFL